MSILLDRAESEIRALREVLLEIHDENTGTHTGDKAHGAWLRSLNRYACGLPNKELNEYPEPKHQDHET